MGGTGRIFLMLLLLVIMTTYNVSILSQDGKQLKADDSKAALKTATMIATYNLLDSKNVNATYEGSKREPNDIPINYDTRDFFVNTVTNISEAHRQDIKFIGFIAYRHVVAITPDNQKMAPVMYITQIEGAVPEETKVVEFCLGENVLVDDKLFKLADDRILEYVEDPATLPDGYELEYYLASDFGFENARQWRDFVIQTVVAEYINSIASIQDGNVEVILAHQLDQSDMANVVEGPSVFSIVDYGKERVVFLGGAEITLWNRVE